MSFSIGDKDYGKSFLFDSMESDLFRSKNKSLEKQIKIEEQHKNPVISSKSMFDREVVIKKKATEEQKKLQIYGNQGDLVNTFKKADQVL